MRKLDNLYALYETGRRIGTLRALLKSKRVMDNDIGTLLFQCNRSLEYLVGGPVLPISRTVESALKLIVSIGKLLNGEPDVGKQEYGEPINGYFSGPIYEDLDTFQIALSEELKNVPVFYAEAEGNLSTDKLLNGAHAGYPPQVKAVLSQHSKDEIDEAGKCLVFDRPTAAGSHILRSVEREVKAYLLRIPDFEMPPLSRQSWATFITCLEGNGAGTEVTDTLKAINRNHRNPLMHPDETLTLSEAVSLFSICQSMTEALVKDLEKRKLI